MTTPVGGRRSLQDAEGSSRPQQRMRTVSLRLLLIFSYSKQNYHNGLAWHNPWVCKTIVMELRHSVVDSISCQ